jgi:hypothetical protein
MKKRVIKAPSTHTDTKCGMCYSHIKNEVYAITNSDEYFSDGQYVYCSSGCLKRRAAQFNYQLEWPDSVIAPAPGIKPETETQVKEQNEMIYSTVVVTKNEKGEVIGVTGEQLSVAASGPQAIVARSINAELTGNQEVVVMAREYQQVG